MANQTTITEFDIPLLLGQYSLGYYKDCKSFANGAGQTTLLVATTVGKYVLRYYENRSFEHVSFEADINLFLTQENYPVPKIIPNTLSNLISQHDNKPYLFIEFIDGKHCDDPNDKFDQQALTEVIKAVARLHNLTLNKEFSFWTKREVFDSEYCFREYTKQARTVQIEEREIWLKTELESIKIPNDLPKSLCHADLNYGNFLLDGGQVVAVLDFDMSFYYHSIYDVASLIYWWAWPPGKVLNLPDAAFIIEEYSKHRPLSKTERDHIFEALKLIILLGISWSDKSDFEQEKLKIEYLNSLN